MDFQAVREELTLYCHLIYERGYTQASGGNLSCRVPGTAYFAIKRTAVNMRVMTPDDVLIIDADGRVVDGEGKPSKEVNFHLAVLKLRPETGAVVHCHPNHAVAFANNDLELPHTTVTSRKIVGRVPVVEAAPAGSAELCEFVSEGFRQNPESKAILMKQHGVCVVGDTLQQAYNITDLLEQTAHQAMLQVQVSKDLASFRDMAR